MSRDIDAIYRSWQEDRQPLDQSMHEAINSRHYPGTREECCNCGDPTGRAGRGEDSIYVTLLKNYFRCEEGDEIGPLCIACLACLQTEGYVNDDR